MPFTYVCMMDKLKKLSNCKL